MSQSESLSDMSARQVSDGAEVMLSIENRIVFVKKQMRVGSRTLRSRRPDLVSKKNQQKIDIDGSVYLTFRTSRKRYDRIYVMACQVV